MFDDVMSSYTQRFRMSSLIEMLDDDKFVEHLLSISKYFTNTFIMIDELNECDLAFDRDRKRFIDVVSSLHRHEECSFHTLIFSRDERDIREQLETGNFNIVFIVATFVDLRLYVSAWLSSLKIQNGKLKFEIVDSLMNEANEM